MKTKLTIISFLFLLSQNVHSQTDKKYFESKPESNSRITNDLGISVIIGQAKSGRRRSNYGYAFSFNYFHRYKVLKLNFGLQYSQYHTQSQEFEAYNNGKLSPDTIYREYISNKTFDFPFLIGPSFRVNKNLRLFLAAGPSIGITLSEKRTDKFSLKGEKSILYEKPPNKTGSTELLLGIAFNSGLEYKLTEKYSLEVNFSASGKLYGDILSADELVLVGGQLSLKRSF